VPNAARASSMALYNHVAPGDCPAGLPASWRPADRITFIHLRRPGNHTHIAHNGPAAARPCNEHMLRALIPELEYNKASSRAGK